MASLGLPVDPPSLLVSHIVLDSMDDSVAAQVGSSREESCVLLGIVRFGSTSTAAADASLLADSPLPLAEFLLQDLQWARAAPRPQDVIEGGDSRPSSRVPRWRMAQEGPFLAERSTSILRALGAGCAFRRTTYRVSDPRGGYSGYILVGVCPGTPKKGGLRCGHSPKRGVLGAGTAPKRGVLVAATTRKRGVLGTFTTRKRGNLGLIW